MIADLALWHASVVELIWTGIGLTGTYFGVKNVKSSRKEIDGLRKLNGNTFASHDVMRVLTYGHYRNDCFRLAKHLTIVGMGLLASILPPQVQSQPVTPVGIVITGGLFTISILIVLASALDSRQREILGDMV